MLPFNQNNLRQHMKLLRLATLCLIGFTFKTTHADPITNWGAPFYGVQLSIASSNTIMLPGSTNTLHCWIKNSSTNSIDMFRAPSLLPATSFLITNVSGLSFRLKPNDEESGISGIEIKSGKTIEWFVPLEIGRNVESGNYDLKATQWVIVLLNGTNNPGGAMESNILKVRIK